MIVTTKNILAGKNLALSVRLPVVHFLPVAYSLCFECLLSTQASWRYVTHTNTATKFPPPVKTTQGLRQWT